MRKSILIVDDNTEVKQAVRLTIESASSFKVCAEAVNGLDAIEKAKELKPDLIILDLSMPIMNGIEAAKVLRVLMPSVPLILFTMHSGTELESVARAAGIAAVVSKSQGLEGLMRQASLLLPSIKRARR